MKDWIKKHPIITIIIMFGGNYVIQTQLIDWINKTLNLSKSFTIASITSMAFFVMIFTSYFLWLKSIKQQNLREEKQ